MKIHSLNKKDAVAKLELTRPEDCWALTHIIEPHDLVKARTIRKIKMGAEGDRKQSVVKKQVVLTVETEKVELSESTIRVLGIIRDGPEDIARGQFHTIALEDKQSFTLTKPQGFKAHHIARLNDATKPAPNQILLILHDREQAIIAVISSGYKILTRLKGKVAKKDQEQQAEDFYKNLTKSISEYQKRFDAQTIIIASPAFFKEDLMKVMPQDLKKKVILATSSSVTANGIEEVLKKDEVKKALAQDRLTNQLKLVEQVQHEIAKDGKVAYGTNEVMQAAASGAVLTLMVTENKIKLTKENGTFDQLDQIMMQADQAGAQLVLVESDTEPGKRIDGLSGIVALLRYKLN